MQNIGDARRHRHRHRCRSSTDLLDPLTDGIDNGLVSAGNAFTRGFYYGGEGLDSIVGGAGSIAQGALSGVGNTLDDLPDALDGVLDDVGNKGGLVGRLLDDLL